MTSWFPDVFSEDKKPQHRDSKTKKPRHQDSKTNKPRHPVLAEFWPSCSLIAVTCKQPPELESATTHSQPQDGISLKSDPGAGARVIRRMESAATRIQPPELESAVSCIQPLELDSTARRRDSCNSYPAAGTRVSHRIVSSATGIQPPELEWAAG